MCPQSLVGFFFSFFFLGGGGGGGLLLLVSLLLAGIHLASLTFKWISIIYNLMQLVTAQNIWVHREGMGLVLHGVVRSLLLLLNS